VRTVSYAYFVTLRPSLKAFLAVYKSKNCVRFGIALQEPHMKKFGKTIRGYTSILSLIRNQCYLLITEE
jgi:hypothetical protein